MIAVREYQPSDLIDVTNLMSDLGYPTSITDMRRRMKNFEAATNSRTMVAELDNRVVGMIGLSRILNYESDDIVTHINCLVTKSEFRGMGVGRALMEYAERWASNNGSPILYLTSGIKEERKRAHEFYRKYGFKVTGYRFVKRVIQD